MLPAKIVSCNDFRHMGRMILDVNHLGALVAADRLADIGEPMLVEFRLPGDGDAIEALGRVVRIVHGRRPYDRGYCLGIEFTFMPIEQQWELVQRLRGTPPPVPARHLRPLAS
jgi:hypothetical protein